MKQIKSCLKNLLANLKYYFVHLGICMFFIVIVSFTGLPLILDSIKSTFAKIGEKIVFLVFHMNNEVYIKKPVIDETQKNKINLIFIA